MVHPSSSANGSSVEAVVVHVVPVVVATTEVLYRCYSVVSTCYDAVELVYFEAGKQRTLQRWSSVEDK